MSKRASISTLKHMDTSAKQIHGSYILPTKQFMSTNMSERNKSFYLFYFILTGLYTPGFTEVGLEKHNDLAAFLKARPGKFVVDSHYTDFFG